MRVVGLILAAGTATRFGSDKLAAPLRGKPVLDHVIDALLAVPIQEIVVVTRAGRRMPSTGAAVTVVLNLTPEIGLSSSLRLGIDAVGRLGGPPVDAVLVALGDQPELDPDVIRRLLAAAERSDRPVVTPRYERDASRNPVLLRRAAFVLLAELTGDRGLGPVLDAHHELVLGVPVEGANPDVDTPADLAKLAR